MFSFILQIYLSVVSGFVFPNVVLDCLSRVKAHKESNLEIQIQGRKKPQVLPLLKLFQMQEILWNLYIYEGEEIQGNFFMNNSRALYTQLEMFLP